MSMSKDLIEFTFTTNSSTGRNDEATTRAAHRAFGVSVATLRGHMIVNRRIRCRPSQFARFIVYRVEEGGMPDGIQCLKPKIIPAVDHSFVGVSTNQAGD